jgi:hypothetical protein
MNPRTFSLFNIPLLEQMVRPGEHLQEVASDFKAMAAKKTNWLKLLRGEISLRDAGNRIFQILTAMIAGMRRKLLHLLRRPDSAAPAMTVPANLLQMVERGVDTFLVVSENDVGVTYVDLQHGKQMRALERVKGFRRVNLKNTDHLFTSLYSQDLVLKTVTEHLSRKYP